MGSTCGEEKVLEGIEKSGIDTIPDDKWVPTSNDHEAPKVKVTEPSGSFCQMDVRFSVPLPPDDVYEIIIDPNNRRVFKNVKEVTYRKVLEDDGNRQLVEVEQLGRWRFLVFNGAFACRCKVEQNKKEHTMSYQLSKLGMMKKFMGSWKIEPIFADDPDSKSTGHASTEQASAMADGRLTGSWITLHQVVQPTLVPPWPLSKYVRGVCGQVIQDVCADLQIEAMRLAELKSHEEVKANTDMHQIE